MPYIKQQRRKELLGEKRQNPQVAGELNFMFTTLLLDYVTLHGVSYQTFNDILGALEGAKFELYLRKIFPYEQIKAKENGDIY